MGDDLGVRVRVSSWSQPDIFDAIGRLAGIGGAEMRATFNCGIGFAVVLEEAAVKPAIDLLAAHEIEAWQIGDVRSLDEPGSKRYVEA